MDLTNSRPAVFVLDSDASALHAISRLLSSEFLVRAYDSPDEFLEVIRPETPGCIVLDVALPGVSGLELQAQLIEAGCFQPVVFLSRHASVRSIVQALQAGAIDFIEKPWESEALTGVVRRALERYSEIRRRRDAAASISRRVASLTPRENEVFRHVIAGFIGALSRCAASGPETCSLATVAADCGYFDQAHMVHDFVELAGIAPSRIVVRDPDPLLKLTRYSATSSRS